jgi:hypothetical protein
MGIIHRLERVAVELFVVLNGILQAVEVRKNVCPSFHLIHVSWQIFGSILFINIIINLVILLQWPIDSSNKMSYLRAS